MTTLQRKTSILMEDPGIQSECPFAEEPQKTKPPPEDRGLITACITRESLLDLSRFLRRCWRRRIVFCKFELDVVVIVEIHGDPAAGHQFAEQ